MSAATNGIDRQPPGGIGRETTFDDEQPANPYERIIITALKEQQLLGSMAVELWDYTLDPNTLPRDEYFPQRLGQIILPRSLS